MVSHYKERYVAVGPFFSLEKVKGEFEELPLPENYKRACDSLGNEGIRIHWGRWLIPGSPQVLLIDYSELLGHANDIKRRLWDSFHIDSLNTASDITDVFVWGWYVGKLIEILSSASSSKTVAHFHEWLSAPGLLYLKQSSSPSLVQTVFTTHATMLGRSLAESGFDLYENIGEIDDLKEAYRLGIATKHLTEKAAVKACDQLTTVSDVTALEVKYFLEREVNGVLPNGLDMNKYPTLEEIALQHRQFREQMRGFLLYYFLPYYEIDIKNSLFYFISGRYELKNKGIDVFIAALGKLNRALKKKKKSKIVVAFLFIPTMVRRIREEVIENREMLRDIQRTFEEVEEAMRMNIMYHVLSDVPFSLASLFGRERAKELEIKRTKFRRSGNPPLSPYEVADPNDSILRLLSQEGLANASSDRVKVIYYPVYLKGGDGLLNLDYHEMMIGSHFGVFPSLYEPWGYTPLETAAFGVASLTTDYAGFGQFVETLRKSGKIPSNHNEGIYVVSRKKRTSEDVTNDLADKMIRYAQFLRKERVANKIAARSIAEYADWKKLIRHYIDTYERAFAR